MSWRHLTWWIDGKGLRWCCLVKGISNSFSLLPCVLHFVGLLNNQPVQVVIVENVLVERVAKHFGVSRQSIHQLWKNFSGTGGDLLSKSLKNVKRKTGSGRPPKYDMDQLIAHVQAIPIRQRMTVRDLAAKLSIPYSTLHAMMQQHDAALRSHTSALKPELKEQNTLERVMYAH